MSESDLAAYVSSLTRQEQLVLDIAKEHLETSFDIGTSLGFLKWKAEREVETTAPPPEPKKKRRRRRLIRRKPD